MTSQAFDPHHAAATGAPDICYRQTGTGDAFEGETATLRDSAQRIFSLDRLATYFASAATRLGIHAASPWEDLALTRPLPPRPNGSSNVGELRSRLTAAVERAVDGHACVAVAMSSGLASAVVAQVTARLCALTGRRLVIVTLDVADDLGRHCRPAAASIMQSMGIDAEHLTIQARPSRWPEPEWNAAGPQLVAWPRYRAGLAVTAQDAGATILLNGHGASRLMPAPRFLQGELARRGERAALSVYRRDTATALIAELATAVPLRWGAGARLYRTVTWPCKPDATVALTDRHRPAARSWHDSFITESVRAAVIRRANWAQADLMHRVLPYDRRPHAASIAESSPFLDWDFLRYAYDLPLHCRFTCEQPTACLRRNALLARLLPTAASRFGASTFHRARTRYWHAVDRGAPHLVELGMVPSDWSRHCRTAWDRAVVITCEAWVAEAIARGAVPA